MAPKKFDPQNFSLGVTALLDDLLAKEEAAREAAEQAGEAGPPTIAIPEEDGVVAKDELVEAFSRTAELSSTLAKRRAARADRMAETTFSADFGDTGGSLDGLLKANEERLAKVRAEILEALAKQEEVDREEESSTTPFTVTGRSAFTEVGDGAGGDGDGAGGALEALDSALDLEKLLRECDAIREKTSQWRGLTATPRGWKRLDPAADA